jgi:hypothetical protein
MGASTVSQSEVEVRYAMNRLLFAA